ncbi:hypothetical protein ACWEOZ_10610 [Actinoplanes sp. NPDC004185]
MDANGEHHVARIDDTVTSENLHARAEAVAVPDFNYLEQMVEGIVAGLTRGRRRRDDSSTTPDTTAPKR